VSAVVHEMTPLSWLLFGLLLLAALLLLGCAVTGVVLWLRGFRTSAATRAIEAAPPWPVFAADLDAMAREIQAARDAADASLDAHCDQAGVTDVRPERDR
jgi:hypothetical protein